jgi:hypothetical protein
LLKLRQWFGTDFPRTFHRCEDEDCQRKTNRVDSIGFLLAGFMAESRFELGALGDSYIPREPAL